MGKSTETREFMIQRHLKQTLKVKQRELLNFVKCLSVLRIKRQNPESWLGQLADNLIHVYEM